MALAAFLNKWLHLISIVGTLGGIIYAWAVLVPALRAQPADSDIVRALWRRTGIVMMGLWLIVLATGFLNYYIVTPTVTGTYHMEIGMKIVLVLFMLVVSTLLFHPLPAFSALRERRGPLLGLLVLVGIAILGISASLNIGRVNGSLLLKSPAAAAAQAGGATAPAP